MGGKIAINIQNNCKASQEIIRDVEIGSAHVFFKIFLLASIDRIELWQETGWVKRSKGQESNLGCCSEDKTSVHRMPALPTELNISQSALFLTVLLLRWKKTFWFYIHF